MSIKTKEKHWEKQTIAGQTVRVEYFENVGGCCRCEITSLDGDAKGTAEAMNKEDAYSAAKERFKSSAQQ